MFHQSAKHCQQTVRGEHTPEGHPPSSVFDGIPEEGAVRMGSGITRVGPVGSVPWVQNSSRTKGQDGLIVPDVLLDLPPPGAR